MHSCFSEGFAIVRSEKQGHGRFGFIDRSGKLIIKPRFDFAESFSEGLALVYVNGACGYVNPKGEMVMEPTFSFATSFSEGLAGVEKGTLASPEGFYIDKSGKTVIRLDPSVTVSGCFKEGLASVRTIRNSGEDALGFVGFVDKEGRVVIDPVFEQAGRFSEGLAPVKLNGKWGYIDRKGKVVIPMKFDFAFPFANGAARVRVGDKRGYIDKRGEYFWKPTK